LGWGSAIVLALLALALVWLLRRGVEAAGSPEQIKKC
jgi:uncharacterized protein (TIGR03382 family)